MAAVAISVFGTPITHGTRTQRAQEAAKYQNADGKLDQALQVSLNSQKAASVGVNPLATNAITVLIYNATGDSITYVTSHDWPEGQNEGNHYPKIIYNGQWALFVYRGTCKGAVGAVVYNLGQDQNSTDSMIAWNDPKKPGYGGKNTAYCEMNYPGYFNHCNWNLIYEKLKASGSEHQASRNGYMTTVSIDKYGDNPHYRAIFTTCVCPINK